MYSYKRFMVILVVFVYTGCDDLVSSEAKQDFRHLAGVFATKNVSFHKILGDLSLNGRNAISFIDNKL